MQKKKFSDVFGKIKLSANVKSMLANSNVYNISVNKNDKKMNIFIYHNKIINEKCLLDFEEDIKNTFPYLKKVNIDFRYKIEDDLKNKIEKYWDNIVNIIKDISPICFYAIKEALWKFEDGVLKIKLNSSCSFLFKFKHIDIIIKNIVKQRFDENIKVEFIDNKIDKVKEPSKEEMDLIISKAIEYSKNNSLKIDNTNDLPKFPKRTKRVKLKISEIEEPASKISDSIVCDETVVLEGKVILSELVTTKNGKYILKVDITDKTDSIGFKFFIDPKNYTDEYKELVAEGSYVKIKGKVVYDEYSKELLVMADSICKAEEPEIRMDNAEVKRVELHLHTQMSMMDGITSAKDYINRAKKWGHKAVAITDHGVVQAYPEAMLTSEKTGVKILYGCEAYLVDDLGSVVKNAQGQNFESEFVVFDIETTGLKKETDKIIEIGAVKIKNNEIIDRFSVFINPHFKLSEKIVSLTGITDDMLKDAEDEADVMPKFIEFCGDAVLVAHNAGFDTGFLRHWAINNNIAIENTVLDTLELARTLFPELKNHKLDTVCERLNVILENHHRAVEDAEATAQIFIKCIDILKQKDIESIEQINTLSSKTINKRMIKKYYHIIILVKNMTGLRNLYELVSKAHIDYFLRRPKIPKSELMKFREGLILGSACEAGELYSAVYENQPEETIKELVDFYDYLEIQPIANNRFMINNESKNGKSVENEEKLIELNKKIVELGEKYNKKVAATCDCHFLDPEDEIFRRIVQTGEGFKNVDNSLPLFYRTTEEMLEEFAYLGEKKAYEVVVENTNYIADLIENIRPIPKGTFPPKMDDAEEILTKITTEKAKEIYGDPLPPIIENRLNKELNSIISNGFAVLYVIAQKLVWNSNENGYIVGSRGSVGSSFVATMAGITEVNPLDPHYVCPNCKYSDFESEEVKAVAGNSGFDLPDKKCPVCGAELKKDGQAIPFETFLGFNGDKEPDIDLNFSGEYQLKAHRYCETLFGDGHVFKAGTVSTLQDKTAFGYVKKYCEQRNITMHSAEMRRLALGCVGVKRTTGQHPGGLIVVPSDNSIYNFTPVQRPANDFNSIVKTTHYDFHSIHDNLLKLDMLGHDVPTILRMFQDITGFDPLQVPMNDKETLSLFTSSKALGVTEEEIECNTGSLGLPEFGTNFVRQMLIETQPSTFSDLVKISGLSHGTDVWNGNAQELINNGICTLKDVIPTRDDIMVYLILKGVENKMAFTIMESVRKGKGLTDEFEAAMREHDVPEWYIDSCKKIKYMFPKGHAVAYVTNTFRIGYFKINYPYAFYAASFSVKVEDFDYCVMCFGRENVKKKMYEIKELGKAASAKDKSMLTMLEIVNEMYARGLKFVKMDLYESDAVKFKVLPDGLLPPLCTVEGLGENAAYNVVESRKNGEFETIEEFKERTKVSKTVIELLKQNGVLAGIPETNQLTLF